MKKHKMIFVEWDDISADTRWIKQEEVVDCTPFACQTVGWRMKSDRKVLRIASTLAGDNKCTDITVIPRGCIRKIREIE